MEITKELLLNNGFDTIPCFEDGTINYLQKHIPDSKTITLCDGEDGLNSDRKWLCQIDDERSQSIGSVEISTTEHLELVCQLYELDYTKVISKRADGKKAFKEVNEGEQLKVVEWQFMAPERTYNLTVKHKYTMGDVITFELTDEYGHESKLSVNADDYQIRETPSSYDSITISTIQ